jgi:cell division protein FtsA
VDADRNEYVIALDLGTSMTRCLIAEIDTEADRLAVVGRGEVPSLGMRRGEVVEIAKAKFAVRQAIAAAEEQAKIEVKSLLISAGSRHVDFVGPSGYVGITREDRTVHARDVRAVLADAAKSPLPSGTVALESLVRSYAVEDVRHVRNPVGMRGSRLDVFLHVITDARTPVENLSACVDTEKHHIEQHVFPAYAAAEAVLSDDERKLGVAVVDIGAGTTRILMYLDSEPVFTSVVAIGGDHLTNDIAVGMDLKLGEAAELKEAHALVGATRLNKTIKFRRVAKDFEYEIDPRRLQTIVDCRVEEIFDIVRREMLRACVRPGAVRVVLTGGASRLPGIEELAASKLGCPVSIGRPRHPAFDRMGPDMATVAGMLLVGRKVLREQQVPAERPSTLARFAGWLGQFF